MSRSTLWIAAALILLGMAASTQYMGQSAAREPGTTAITISPEEITRTAPPLPTLVLRSYF
jgi:hypothetical protein